MSARLETPPPVKMFWLVIDDDFKACVAYCEACKQTDRSWFDYRRERPLGTDEREALQRLRERKECPHTETAQLVLQLQFLEEPSR